MELFRKIDSRFYWYDFKVRGKRYRGSTKETNKKKAGRIGALRLSQALGNAGLLDQKAPTLQEFSSQFLRWLESATLAKKTTKYYTNGWRLLSGTKLVRMRLDRVTKDDVDALAFPGSGAPSVNCALRTLRRMLRQQLESRTFYKEVPLFCRFQLHESAASNSLCSASSSSLNLRLCPGQCSICYGMSSSLLGIRGCGTSENSTVSVSRISTGLTKSFSYPTARRRKGEG